MAAPRNPVEVMRECRLSSIEAQVYDICREAADRDLPAPSTEVIMQRVGAMGMATVPGIMRRLEGKGFIRRLIYQRGRTITITATGKSTAPPNNTAPHWRQRTEHMPTPTIQVVRERVQSTAMQIEADARSLGKPLAVHLADLVYIGHHAFRQEQENRSCR